MRLRRLSEISPTSQAVTRFFARFASADGKQEYEIQWAAYTGASPIIEGDRAYFGTFTDDVVALDLKARKVIWRFDDPERDFPFYSLRRC